MLVHTRQNIHTSIALGVARLRLNQVLYIVYWSTYVWCLLRSLPTRINIQKALRIYSEAIKFAARAHTFGIHGKCWRARTHHSSTRIISNGYGFYCVCALEIVFGADGLAYNKIKTRSTKVAGAARTKLMNDVRVEYDEITAILNAD